MKFTSVRVPKYDCEIFNEQDKPSSPRTGAKQRQLDLEENKQKYLVLGLSKGSIIFVNIDLDPEDTAKRDLSLEKVYSRFSIHRQAVNYIQEIP